jgi:DNA invertase Pin-like site-specific DNA recombinase
MTTGNPTKPRAIIYQQLCAKGSTPKGQLVELKAYAIAQGWDVIQIITDRYDPDIKAPKERTGLVEMLWLARMKKFDVLLAWSLDDLSRVGVKHTLNHLQTLRNNSVDWCFLKDPLLNSQGEDSGVVLAVLARLADSANLRYKRRITKEYEAGTKAGKKGRIPTGKLYAPTIEKAKKAQKLRKSGMKFRAIAEELGVTYPRAYQLCQYKIETD